MKLFNSNHCIFTIIYQNSKDDEISYIFEFLNYDLRLFYEYNQNFNRNNKTNWDNYLISKLPTFSSKQFKIKISKKNYLYFSIFFFLVYLSLINFLWIAINIIGILYLLSIPVSVWSYKTKG